MNEVIVTHFESYQHRLIESPAISRFYVVKRRVGSNDGHIRIRAILSDSGLLEFSEYIVLNCGLLTERQYSFQWQDAKQRLIRRWDNAMHFEQLPYAPHHIHHFDGTVEGNPAEPTLNFILDAIEQQIAQ